MNQITNLWRRTLDNVQDRIAFIYAFDNTSPVQGAGVAGLAAAGGIERCAIERDCYRTVVALVYAGDASIEFEQA